MMVLRAIARGRAGDGAVGAASVLDTAARCYGSVPPDRIAMRAATLRRRPMANIDSQKKRILRAERERLENRRYTSTIKTYFRRLEAAVSGGDAEAAQAEHRRVVQMIDKAVKRGALHRNTGARKKSRAARVLRGGSDAA
jgi:small subunit ribosomal protein S20